MSDGERTALDARRRRLRQATRNYASEASTWPAMHGNRQLVRDFLWKMARSTVSTSPVALSRAAHVARLKLLCDSDFKRAWLDWADAANLRLPDKADIAVKDAAINRCPEDAGYSVVRFPKEQAAWPDVVRRHAWLFGEMEH